jgi:hypothetical protein
MPRPASALCSVGVAILLLAGCTTPTTPGGTGQSPTPEATVEAAPSPSASPITSPEPVVIAPQRPAAMDDDGYEGAAAAAEYFLTLDDYIMKTGDTAEFEAMSHKTCDYCTKRLEQAREIADAGHVWTSGDTRVTTKHVYEQDIATGLWPMDVTVSQGAVELNTSTGDPVYAADAENLLLGVEVLRSDDRWLIVEVGDVNGRPE